jgi:hypothetical protein
VDQLKYYWFLYGIDKMQGAKVHLDLKEAPAFRNASGYLIGSCGLNY